MLRFVALVCLATACLASPFHKLPTLDGRIVGGEDANIVDYPYQLSLEKSTIHSCGASIVNENWALTAAHCVDSLVIATWTLRSNTTERRNGGVARDVVQKVVHPLNNPSTFEYDFALLKVGVPFVYGVGVQPIALPAQNQTTDEGLISTITGWGATSSGGSLANILQVVFIPVTNQTYCNNAYGGDITDSMICAGVDEGGVDSCQGDSGGPMVVDDELVGVVSWGRGCALPRSPGVYGRVSAATDWILETILT